MFILYFSDDQKCSKMPKEGQKGPKGVKRDQKRSKGTKRGPMMPKTTSNEPFIVEIRQIPHFSQKCHSYIVFHIFHTSQKTRSAKKCPNRVKRVQKR